MVRLMGVLFGYVFPVVLPLAGGFAGWLIFGASFTLPLTVIMVIFPLLNLSLQAFSEEFRDNCDFLMIMFTPLIVYTCAFPVYFFISIPDGLIMGPAVILSSLALTIASAFVVFVYLKKSDALIKGFFSRSAGRLLLVLICAVYGTSAALTLNRAWFPSYEIWETEIAGKEVKEGFDSDGDDYTWYYITVSPWTNGGTRRIKISGVDFINYAVGDRCEVKISRGIFGIKYVNDDEISIRNDEEAFDPSRE
jgi:hypothetical protein